MAENTFRSYRNRDSAPRGDFDTRDTGNDPLAELARLIGQGDPTADYAHDGKQGPPEPLDDSSSAGGLDWAANEDDAEQNQGYAEQERPEERYTPPPLAASYPAYSSNQAYAPPETEYANEPQAASQYPAPQGAFETMREDTRDDEGAHDARYPTEDAPPIARGRQLPAFAPQSQDRRFDANEQRRDGGDDQPYSSDDYYDEAPEGRRRSGSVVVLAVLGLVVLGTAGAFAYRTMFGGSVLPTLPPIIKASDGPIKVVPASGESRPGGARQASAGGAGSAEKLVPREEQPLDIPEPAKTPGPRVVSTIPIGPGQGAPASGSVLPGAAASAASPFPSPPSAASGAALSQPAATPAGASPGPKKIHTVTIRADQPGGADAAAAPPPPRSVVARAAPPPRAVTAPPPPSGANAPLALVPEQGGASAPPPPRTRTALARPTSLSPTAENGPPVESRAAPAAGGGYAVQVTSQRSEAEAETAFRSLQAKYPGQLGGRRPMVRRADLGAKGVYYRALVGPYASAEQAAGVCSSLKAAGGNCIVQRN